LKSSSATVDVLATFVRRLDPDNKLDFSERELSPASIDTSNERVVVLKLRASTAAALASALTSPDLRMNLRAKALAGNKRPLQGEDMLLAADWLARVYQRLLSTAPIPARPQLRGTFSSAPLESGDSHNLRTWFVDIWNFDVVDAFASVRDIYIVGYNFLWCFVGATWPRRPFALCHRDLALV